MQVRTGPGFLIVAFTYFTANEAKIMRNNALLSKMVSNFQKDNNLSYEPPAAVVENKSEKKIMTLMKNVLCRNFPSIPCHMIIQDATLSKLIERSIQQIDNKRFAMDATTRPAPRELALLPVINSEDLSSFLQVQNTGTFKEKSMKMSRRQMNKHSKLFNNWSPERASRKQRKKAKDTKQTSTLGRTNLRKFYPHKYKDKASKHEFNAVSDDRSVSGEHVDGTHRQARYNPESPADPVWRIDYMKHGEPNLNGMVGGEQLRGKMIRTGGLMVEEALLEQAARKDVLHPDVYIKTNLVRRNAIASQPTDEFD